MHTTYAGPIRDTWEHDHLDRVQVARFLTQYLDGIYEESNPDLSNGHFVLNLNASWGQGKTFLLTKWGEDLRKANYPVVRFDAWVNDFSRDPLVGFMSELYEALDPWLKDIAPAKAAMQKVKKSAAKVIGAGVGILAGGAAAALTEAGLNMLSGKYDVSETATDAVSGKAAEGAGKLAERALKDHKTTQKAIADFKENLEKLIKAIEGNTTGKKLPLYIFVDELDRCRPTYAIELLENIKHLFGVRGVFFVVATNKEQLCHSISAVYGSGFDSSAYLGRFFDQEYTLPDPNNQQYAKFLFDKYKIEDDDRFITDLPIGDQHPPHLQATFALFSDAFKLSLRDQEQTVHRLKAILSVYRKEVVYFDYLVFLLMLKKRSDSLLNRIPQRTGFDLAAFKLDLSPICNLQMVVKVPLVSHWKHQVKESELSLTKLIDKYLTKISQTKWSYSNGSHGNKDEQLRTEWAFLDEARRPNSKIELFSFTEYPNLVNQVGQLS